MFRDCRHEQAFFPVMSINKGESVKSPVIRRATEADIESIGRLGALLVSTHHDFDARRFIPPTDATPQWYASFLGGQLANSRVVMLVAEIDGVVAGYSYSGLEGYDWMSLRGPAGVIYDILVDAEYRHHGIGKELLDATVEALKSQGATQILLSTATQNVEAQRLFERAGFRRTMIEMTRDL
jgi:ribosomal protein S18 acetylase RimI-like enzyme